MSPRRKGYLPACVTQGNSKHARWCGSQLARVKGGARKEWLLALRMRAFYLGDSVLPEGFEAWPRDIQLRFMEEYHALYFPDR